MGLVRDSDCALAFAVPLALRGSPVTVLHCQKGKQNVPAQIVKLKCSPRKRSRPVDPDDISPISRDVPPPLVPVNGHRRYPFDAMTVGDSFTIPKDRLGSMRAVLSRFRKLFPEWAFTSSAEGERIRVWRIK